MINKKELEIYIHIPFCVKKCLYCDFLSAPADDETKRGYIEALSTEISERAPEFGDHYVVSVFIGGGTPSVMDPDQMVGLLQILKERYQISHNAEITMEINPGTVDEKKLQKYREAGVNRLSIGLQSADDGLLSAIGRIHTWQQFCDTYDAASRLFDNINVDIMSTLPGQSLESYRDTISKVLSLCPRPKHISAYSLILEEGTGLYEQVKSGKIKEPDEELDRLMYHETARILSEAGYKRYEISNYAVPGYECKHNCGYWTGRDYVGFGIGAASLLEGKRFTESKLLGKYLSDPLGCRENIESLDRNDQMEEFMFLGLRLTEGISANRFFERFDVYPEDIYGSVIQKNLKDGLLCYSKDQKRLMLTDRGLDLSNYVMAQFLLS